MRTLFFLDRLTDQRDFGNNYHHVLSEAVVLGVVKRDIGYLKKLPPKFITKAIIDYVRSNTSDPSVLSKLSLGYDSESSVIDAIKTNPEAFLQTRASQHTQAMYDVLIPVRPDLALMYADFKFLTRENCIAMCVHDPKLLESDDLPRKFKKDPSFKAEVYATIDGNNRMCVENAPEPAKPLRETKPDGSALFANDPVFEAETLLKTTGAKHTQELYDTLIPVRPELVLDYGDPLFFTRENCMAICIADPNLLGDARLPGRYRHDPAFKNDARAAIRADRLKRANDDHEPAEEGTPKKPMLVIT